MTRARTLALLLVLAAASAGLFAAANGASAAIPLISWSGTIIKVSAVLHCGTIPCEQAFVARDDGHLIWIQFPDRVLPRYAPGTRLQFRGMDRFTADPANPGSYGTTWQYRPYIPPTVLGTRTTLTLRAQVQLPFHLDDWHADAPAQQLDTAAQVFTFGGNLADIPLVHYSADQRSGVFAALLDSHHWHAFRVAIRGGQLYELGIITAAQGGPAVIASASADALASGTAWANGDPVAICATMDAQDIADIKLSYGACPDWVVFRTSNKVPEAYWRQGQTYQLLAVTASGDGKRAIVEDRWQNKGRVQTTITLFVRESDGHFHGISGRNTPWR